MNSNTIKLFWFGRHQQFYTLIGDTDFVSKSNAQICPKIVDSMMSTSIAMIETMEILSNPEAMRAIREFEAGKTKMKPVECLDED